MRNAMDILKSAEKDMQNKYRKIKKEIDKLQKKEYYKKNKKRLLKKSNDRNNRFEKQNRQILYFFKRECKNCGSKDYEHLQFHHTNKKDKILEVGKMVYRTTDALLKEINKCIVLCDSCHTKLHKKGSFF